MTPHSSCAETMTPPETAPTPQSQAIAARAANDHATAIDAWRRLLETDPDNWRIALELKHDLQEAWHSADSDPRFRHAAQFLPDEAWLDHYAAGFNLPGCDLPTIRARALTLRTRRPTEARIEALLGQAASQMRDWPEAARAYRAAALLAPGVAIWPERAAQAHHFARLETTLPRGGTPDYTVLVINMDANTERWAETLRARPSLPVAPQRIPAIPGPRIPCAAVRRLTNNRDAPRGTLGCFLSHAAAWEHLLASPAEAALILEDDALPSITLPPQSAALGIPPGWDLVWVNERMGGQPASNHLACIPANQRVAAFAQDFDAPGADAYLISRAGARKLLDWCATDGFEGDVDWRLVAYATPTEIARTLPAGSTPRRFLDPILAQLHRPDRLTAYALTPGLVRELSLRSDRVDADRIAASKIDADRIAASKIDADRIAASKIDADRIARMSPELDAP